MVPKIKNVMVLTDLSEQSHKELTYAASLADAYGAAITVLHAFEIESPSAALIASAYLGYASMDEFKEKREADLVEEIKSRIKQTCDEIEGRFQACRFSFNQIIVETGRTNDIILQHVKKNDFDMIVMGSHSNFKELILGGTAQKVIRHARKPVLVIPLERAA